MRFLALLVIVGVCLVSAKYLPDDTSNFNQLLSRHKRSDSEDSLDESSSNDTDSISDEELREQSKLHARIEKMRQKLLVKQEKERRRQEEAQQKLEEKIARELQKEEERRQKEDERRQKELQKEEERRQKELQKEEEIRQKEEEKRLKDLQKNEEKLEKERQKLEEQQKKLKEKALENERKQQEMLQKQLEQMEEETLKLQEADNNSSDSDTDESTELEDFWKSYIYSKYGLNENNTDLEKRIALRRYMQEELGLNVNSTESERRQAILRLIESKWQAVSEQYSLQSQMTDFVNRVGVQKIRAQLEKEIEEINNKTDTLSNVNLPWVPLARNNFAEQVSFLQTIKEFLASIVPNWYNENVSSTEATFNGVFSSNETVFSVPSDSSSSSSDNNSSSTIKLGSDLGSSTIVDADELNLAIGTGIDNNTPLVSGSATDNADIFSTKVVGSAPDSVLDVADVDFKNDVNSNGYSIDEMSSVVGKNIIGIIPLTSEQTNSNFISNKDTSSSVISGDALTPALTSVTPGAGSNDEQNSDGSVNTNAATISNQDSLNSVQTASDLINSAAPINGLVSVKPLTDNLFANQNVNNIKNEDKSGSENLPISENASIQTDNANNSPPMSNVHDNLNVPSSKINVSSINQDASGITVPDNDLSNPVIKTIPSLTMNEASEVVLPVETDSEKKMNSKPNNNQGDVLNSLLPNDYSNGGNILPSTTESIRLDIITSGGESSITNIVENNISTAANTASSGVYSGAASTSFNNLPVTTSPPAISTESHYSDFSVINDFAKIKNSDTATDPSNTVLTENSSIITIPIEKVNQSSANNILSLNISSIDDSSGNKNTIINPENTFEPKVNNQNISKTLDVSEIQNSNEPQTTISTVYLEDVTSTVPEVTFENNAIVSSNLSPTGVETEKINDAIKEGDALNTDIVISKNSSTNSGNDISEIATTEPPTSVTDTQTTLLDQFTSVANDAQQLTNNDVTENQYIEKDATLSETGIPVITEIIPNEVEFLHTTSVPENSNSDTIKEQENTTDNITVPVEQGASILAFVAQ